MQFTFWTITLIVLAICWVRYGFLFALVGLAVATILYLLWLGLYLVLGLALLGGAAYLFFTQTSVGRTTWTRISERVRV